MTSYSGTTYGWDVLDQKTQVNGTAAGSEAWTHVYDAAGERIWSRRTSATRTDTFALRGPGGGVLSLFSKAPGSPAPTYSWKDYVYREGQLLGTKLSDGTVRHFDVDHLGTVRLETDGAGATVAYRELWPYGEEATPLASDEKMQFTGHERDLGVLASTADDMDYMHARYYRPLLGRFLSLDAYKGAARAPKRWNRYTYALDNPIQMIDPDGKTAFVFGSIPYSFLSERDFRRSLM
jgi:RHS repeat-associated protein